MKNLKNQVYLGNNSLHVLVLQKMAELMAAADILITKPGGNHCEALVMSYQLLSYLPLPGQEDRNTEYLLNKGRD